MRLQKHAAKLFIMTALAVAALSPSCGGPYTARRVNQPDEKLIIADNLFQKGDYGGAAVEYKDFLAVFAGDERCDFAQFRLAECYMREEDYPLAAVEYRILINDYGYSEYIDDAFYMEGLCSFLQTQRSERDQSKAYEALSRINRFLQVFPESPRREEAEKTRTEIYDLLGQKEFLNARLYFSGKHYNAAMIYFDKVISSYPGSVWVARSHYYKGRMLEEKNKIDEAVAEYRSAASSGFDFEEKSEAESRLGGLEGKKNAGE